MRIKLDHMTYIVKELDKEIEFYQKILGFTPWKLGIVENEEGRMIMLQPDDGARLELIEPNPVSVNPLSNFLKDYGGGLRSICLMCDDFDLEVKELQANGLAVNVEIQQKLFPQNPFRVGWVILAKKHGVWIEIVDAKALPGFEINWETMSGFFHSRRVSH